MKAGEIKMRLSKTAIDLVDTYFGGANMTEKFVNSTLKIIIKQNIYRIDPLLDLFADQHGEINANDIVNEYVNMIDESGFVFDIKRYIDNDMVKNIIPDKVLVIKKEDVMNILT